MCSLLEEHLTCIFSHGVQSLLGISSKIVIVTISVPIPGKRRNCSISTHSNKGKYYQYVEKNYASEIRLANHRQPCKQCGLTPSFPNREMSSSEDSNDDNLDMDWSDVSESDRRNYRDCSFSDDEEEFDCGDLSNQRNQLTEEDPFVSPGLPLKLSESVLLILTLAVAHNLNGSCLSDVIALINLHCIPGPLNKCVSSLSALKKYFADYDAP